MIGIVIVTHRQLGDALIEAAQFIIGKKPEALVSVSIDLNESADVLRAKIAEGIKSVSSEDGVLILTDMFGGTPSNLSYSFLEEGHIEVISGVNLPMLVDFLLRRKDQDLDAMVERLLQRGRSSVQLLKGPGS